jgi:ABC-2 type transport system ATP-binding protein
MRAAVQTEGLTKDFFTGFWRLRPRRALHALSLTVPAGGVFGLLGPNGAGKSTTLKLLIGLLRPSSGRVEVLGASAGAMSARRRIGFLPEQPVFADQLTAEELLGYFAGLFGYAGSARRRRVSELLDRVGLHDDRRRPLRQYSRGMIQRVGIAQALINDAELVILDEPMSGLDPLGRRDVREMVLELGEQGRTVLFSTHVLTDAETMCERAAILANGRLVAAGTIDELTGGAASAAEVVVSNLQPAIAEALASRVRRVRRLGSGRYSLELGPATKPEPLIAELVSGGAALVSVVPIRAPLEEVFFTAVGAEVPTTGSAHPGSEPAPAVSAVRRAASGSSDSRR